MRKKAGESHKCDLPGCEVRFELNYNSRHRLKKGLRVYCCAAHAYQNHTALARLKYEAAGVPGKLVCSLPDCGKDIPVTKPRAESWMAGGRNIYCGRSCAAKARWRSRLGRPLDATAALVYLAENIPPVVQCPQCQSEVAIGRQQVYRWRKGYRQFFCNLDCSHSWYREHSREFTNIGRPKKTA
jgi:hypothetical protein